jgi:hypothetical protein
MNALTPTNAPAEGLQIAPETLEVANCYLQCQDAREVAGELGLPVEQVSQILSRREVKAYINQVFFDLGFNNRFKMRRAMDAVLKQKFQEMESADVGSSKDIADLLALSHKMSMELLDREIQLEKLRADAGLKSQVNVQINEGGDGTKYGALISKLLGDKL